MLPFPTFPLTRHQSAGHQGASKRAPENTRGRRPRAHSTENPTQKTTSAEKAASVPKTGSFRAGAALGAAGGGLLSALRQKADLYAGERERVNPYDVTRSVLTGGAIGTAGGLIVRHAENLSRQAKDAINNLREVSQSIHQMGRAAEKAYDVADKASGSRFYGIFSKRAMRTRAVQQMPSRREAEPEEAPHPSEPISLYAHAEEMLDGTAEAADRLTEIRKQVDAGAAPWKKDSPEGPRPSFKAKVHNEEPTNKAPFPKTAYHQNGQATSPKRPPLSSPVGTYGGVARGRNAAARTAGKTAPTGRESESENVARSMAIPTAALGTLGGMAVARRYRPNIQRGIEGLYRRLVGNRLKRTSSRRAADVIGSIGGGLLAGHATGALVGGSKRLEERLRLQTSPELDRSESTHSNSRENTARDERESYERRPAGETTKSVNSRSSGRSVDNLGRDPVIRKSAGLPRTHLKGAQKAHQTDSPSRPASQ